MGLIRKVRSSVSRKISTLSKDAKFTIHLIAIPLSYLLLGLVPLWLNDYVDSRITFGIMLYIAIWLTLRINKYKE